MEALDLQTQFAAPEETPEKEYEPRLYPKKVPNFLETLGKNLREYRLYKKLTIKDFAATLGVSVTTYMSIVDGTGDPKLSTLKRIRLATGIRICI